VFVLTALALVACSQSTGSEALPASPPSSDLPPLPTLELIAATDEQMALYATADASVSRSDYDTAMTALIALQRTDARSAERARGTLTLAQIYFERSDFDRVALTLDALAETAPPTGDSALLRGRLYLAIDRPAEAEESIERATRLDLDGVRSLAVLSAVQRSGGRDEDAAETELAMERRMLRHAHELADHPRPERAMALLDALDAGFANADAARAVSAALAHEDPVVQAHALAVLERIGGTAIAARLHSYAREGGLHAAEAERIANALSTEDAD
jgi:tetratricopeptide (TPR) repeat protein